MKKKKKMPRCIEINISFNMFVIFMVKYYKKTFYTLLKNAYKISAESFVEATFLEISC